MVGLGWTHETLSARSAIPSVQPWIDFPAGFIRLKFWQNFANISPFAGTYKIFTNIDENPHGFVRVLRGSLIRAVRSGDFQGSALYGFFYWGHSLEDQTRSLRICKSSVISRWYNFRTTSSNLYWVTLTDWYCQAMWFWRLLPLFPLQWLFSTPAVLWKLLCSIGGSSNSEDTTGKAYSN